MTLQEKVKKYIDDCPNKKSIYFFEIFNATNKGILSDKVWEKRKKIVKTVIEQYLNDGILEFESQYEGLTPVYFKN